MNHQPVVPSSELLAMAARNVRESASDGNTRGFMLAFVDDRGVGFSFLVYHRRELCVALHAVPPVGDCDPTHTCVYRQGQDADSLVEEYLKTAAANMRVDYTKLTTRFAERNSDWRFEPWEYGKPGRSQDNDRLWRKKLWPWINDIVLCSLVCIDTVPLNVRHTLLQQLRRHAIEGMIVLER